MPHDLREILTNPRSERFDERYVARRILLGHIRQRLLWNKAGPPNEGELYEGFVFFEPTVPEGEDVIGLVHHPTPNSVHAVYTGHENDFRHGPLGFPLGDIVVDWFI